LEYPSYGICAYENISHIKTPNDLKM
jgi:hypothetical protein